MLGYYLNNQPFALDARSTIRITWENPACYFDEIPGDVGMGIEIPVNETNRMLLGNQEMIERRTKTNDKEYPGFEVRWGGVLLLGGTLVIQKSNKKSYSGWLRSNVGNLGKIHREKYIYDIPGFNEDKMFVNKASYDPDTDDYGCPEIYNPYFFKDKGRRITIPKQVVNPDYYDGSEEPEFIWDDVETEAMTEAFKKGSLFFVNKRNGDNTINVTPTSSESWKIETDMLVHVVSPMLFLNRVLETIFIDAGFAIDNSVLANDADMKRLLVYNNFDITKETFIPGEGVVYGTWGDDLVVITEYIVYKLNYIFRSYDGTFQYKNLLPKIKLKDFLLGIQNLLNVVFVFKPNRKIDIIDRESIFTGDAIDIDAYMLDEWDKGEKKDVTLKFSFTRDDDDTFFQERWTDIDDRRKDEKDPVDTWDSLNDITEPEIGEVRYIRDVNLYVEYAWIQDKIYNPITGDEDTFDTMGWRHLALGFQNGYFSKGKEEQEEISTAFGVVAGDQTVSSYQKGNTKSTKFSYEAFSPRLLFYLGNNFAKYETANLSLDWEKETKGLLAKRWPKWNRFWSQCSPISNQADLPLNMIDYMKRNITSRFRSREGEFIVEKMETEFGIDWIGNTTLSCYKNSYVPMLIQLDEIWNWNNLILEETIIDFGLGEIAKWW